MTTAGVVPSSNGASSNGASSNGASSNGASSNGASSFGASSFGAVLAAVRQGQTVGAAARSLGLSPGLAEAMLDEARRLGLAVSAREVCGACTPASASSLCAGCPVLTRPEV